MDHPSTQRERETIGGWITRTKGVFLGLLICLCATAISMSGCSSKRFQLIEMGDLYMEPIPSTQVYFSDIIARQKGDVLTISGEVSRRNTSFSGAGYVDIAVVSPAGMVIDTASVPYSPRILPKTPGARKHHPSHFEVHLRCIPPQWSIIRIAFHAKAVSSDFMPEEENLALPDDHDYGG